MKLPLLISVPHAGLHVPDVVRSNCILSHEDIVKDGDEGAAEVYDFASKVAQYVTTDVARAIVDMNRPEDDRGADGIVKTHTCWNVPVYREPLTEDVVEVLLETYYRPYHAALSRPDPGVILGVDCHTMAAIGPPIGPGPGVERPAICISNAGRTCPQEWIRSLAECLEKASGQRVSVNHPFKGGFIIRSHAAELPWLQLELSRAPFAASDEKRRFVLEALGEWCARRAE
jgi:formiminoglutamase